MQDVAVKRVKKMELWYGLTIMITIAFVVMPALFGFFTE